MPKIAVGPWIAAQKLPSPALARDRTAFLERTRLRDDPKTVSGLPLVGMGGSCSKPCFALPYLIRWSEQNLDALEGIALEFQCFVEYGLYPHLKLEADGVEVAAVQVWTTFGMVYVRPGFEHGEELLERLAVALNPNSTTA